MKALFVGFATLDLHNKQKRLGGASAVMSINAATLGIDSHLLAPLSRDQKGQYYTQKLNAFNVNIHLCPFSAPSIPTCIIKDPKHQTAQIDWSDNGALSVIKDIHLTKAQTKSYDLIFVANCHPLIIQKILPSLSRKNIIYIPGPQITTKPNYLQTSLLTFTTIIFANSQESPFIQKYNPLKKGVDFFITTQGEKGSLVQTNPGVNYQFPPTKVSR